MSGTTPPSDAKTRFSDRVDDYVRHRPSYPVQAIDDICGFVGIGAGSLVVDVGAGTGISSRPFVERGYTVYAIEPNAAMRDAALEAYSRTNRFYAIDGAAEATTLPDGVADLVACFQAFHWFDGSAAAREFNRIAKPTASVAIVWNERKRAGSPFLKEYDDLLLRLGTDYARVASRQTDRASLAELFGYPFEKRVYANAQTFDLDGLIGRVRSSSYTPKPGTAQYELLIAEVRNLFHRYQTGGTVQFEYETEVFLGRRTSGRAPKTNRQA